MELGFYVVRLSYDSADELPATGYLTVQEGDIVNVLAQDIERGEPNGTYPEWWYCYAMLPPAHPPLAVFCTGGCQCKCWAPALLR